MARYTGPKCKLCRREGVKLFLKGARCDTAKCAIERRQYPPGPRTWRRRKVTPYGQQLREKQKVKRYYGLLERQFRNYFGRAERARGNTGENLLLALERRLDSVLAGLGFASSHGAARQLIRHGHVAVNGRRVTVPGQEINPGDQITPVDTDTSRAAIQAEREQTEGRAVPAWLEVGEEPLVGTATRLPTREDVTLPVEEQLVVELLSK
ncbi:MAG: 30S ribosomal protein S4 [Planctomycetota bacterium]